MKLHLIALLFHNGAYCVKYIFMEKINCIVFVGVTALNNDL